MVTLKSTLILVLVLVLVPPAWGTSKKEITLYPQGTAFFHEMMVPPPTGPWVLKDLPSTLILSSLMVVPEGDVKVLDQRYDSNMISEDSLSQRYIGSTVRVLSDTTQKEGTLVGWWVGPGGKRWNAVQTHNDLAIVGDGDLLFINVGKIPFRPQLSVELSEPRNNSPVHLRYLASGIQWRAEYALLQEKASGTLQGSITVINHSGTGFKDTRLALIAGNLKQRSQTFPTPRRLSMAAEGAMEARDSGPQTESFGDVIRIDLPDPVDLPDGQTRTIHWFHSPSFPVQTEYHLDMTKRFRPSHPPYRTKTENWVSAETQLVFQNSEKVAGHPLASGLIRVYLKEDQRESWMGEQAIPNVSLGDEVRLVTGTAFDVKGKRVVEKVRTILENKEYEESVQYILVNRGDRAKSIRVREPLEPKWTWTILDSSHPHTRPDAGTIQWDVLVPPNSEVLLKVRYRYRR